MGRVRMLEVWFAHFKAMALKNLALQAKRKGSTCCQLIVPIMCALVVGIVAALGPNIGGEKADPYPFPQQQQYRSDWSGEHILYVPPTNPAAMSPGILSVTGEKEGLIGQVRQNNFTLLASAYLGKNFSVFLSPYFTPISSPEAMDLKFYDIELEQFYFCAMKERGEYLNYDPCYYIFNASKGYIFNNIEMNSSIILDYVVQIGGKYTNPTRYISTKTQQSQYMNLIHSAMCHYATNNRSVIEFSTEPLPKNAIKNSVIGNLFALFLIPFAVSFLYSVYMYTIVQEKVDGLVQKMTTCGMSMSTYWVVNYIYHYCLYALVVVVLLIVSYACGIQVFVNRAGPMLLLLFLWGHAQISMCHFLTCFFSSPQASFIVGMLLSIFGSVAGLLITMFVFLQDPEEYPAWGYMLFPFITFYYAFGALVMNVTDENAAPITLEGGTSFSWALLTLLLHTFVFSLFTWYMEEVFPSNIGAKKDPLFPVYALINLIKRIRRGNNTGSDNSKLTSSDSFVSSSSSSLMVASSPSLVVTPEHRINFASEDVENEAHVASSSNSMVRILDMVKIYSGTNRNPDKVALNHVSFRIEQNECFGLLGPNGAGKTTLLSILAGISAPSSGTAIIDNMDVRGNASNIYKILGVCPQFDVLWPELTVEEHLSFFLRLKGLWSGKVKVDMKAHVKEIIAEVGLEEVANRQASGLSGGQKRRLSIAIALMGHPKLVLMDEPTTGLDPSNRRAVWDIVVKAKEKHTIIISTHSMEEAEVLCSRIGIMRKAQLQSIGTPLHLKNKFGLGYNIKMSHFLNCDEKAHNFVMQIIPNAQLVTAFGDLRAYKVLKSDFVLSELFKKMEVSKHRYGVKEWSISLASLEEVFLAIVTEDEADAV